MSIRITCINNSGGYHQDPHHAISHLGWINETTGATGKNTRLEIYDWIKRESGEAYVTDRMAIGRTLGLASTQTEQNIFKRMRMRLDRQSSVSAGMSLRAECSAGSS